MKKRKSIATIAMSMALFTAMSVGASAIDLTYNIDGVAQPEYYGDTVYENVYGAEYNYGGNNVVDYDVPELAYGNVSNTSIGIMEKVKLPTDFTATSTGANTPIVTTPTIYHADEYSAWTPIAFTSAIDLERSDGSIATLKIPTLGINMKVWEGETSSSMAKGVAHYSSSSAWDGNVGLCGHNRGATYTIGNIKDLVIGDTIEYTTALGTRSYTVSYVGTISETDWSYLQATSDNRLTITTCLADQPTLRVVVQAVES